MFALKGWSCCLILFISFFPLIFFVSIYCCLIYLRIADLYLGYPDDFCTLIFLIIALAARAKEMRRKMVLHIFDLYIDLFLRFLLEKKNKVETKFKEVYLI